jgi:putative MFS transporter
VLADQWGLGTSGKALVISSGFAGMFFGASLLGTVADRLGRRKTFLWTLIVYSGFTLAAAASPNLTWLAILRFCSGFGLGAELSLADSYLSELLPRQVRGRYMATAYTLGFFGVPLAAFIGAKFVASEDLLIDGWRWLLIVGSLGALIVWAMRRSLPESPRWSRSRPPSARRCARSSSRRTAAARRCCGSSSSCRRSATTGSARWRRSCSPPRATTSSRRSGSRR